MCLDIVCKSRETCKLKYNLVETPSKFTINVLQRKKVFISAIVNLHGCFKPLACVQFCIVFVKKSTSAWPLTQQETQQKYSTPKTWLIWFDQYQTTVTFKIHFALPTFQRYRRTISSCQFLYSQWNISPTRPPLRPRCAALPCQTSQACPHPVQCGPSHRGGCAWDRSRLEGRNGNTTWKPKICNSGGLMENLSALECRRWTLILDSSFIYLG